MLRRSNIFRSALRVSCNSLRALITLPNCVSRYPAQVRLLKWDARIYVDSAIEIQHREELNHRDSVLPLPARHLQDTETV